MPNTSLAAPLASTQNIAGFMTPQGFVPSQVLMTPNGEDVSNVNHMPAAAIQRLETAGFSAVGASVLDPFFVQPSVVGTGVTYNQAAGSLNILTGTTPNAEFLARSVNTYSGSMRLRASIITSQRIANQNFAILLADLLGEGLAYNIVNSTTVDVSLTAHGFNATNVGQFVLLGLITGAAGVPGRYAIASIPNADTIRFTVAGWPATGSGTLTLFGRNYVRNLINGVTATNVAWDVQRNGWATGDTTATVNTTLSPGTILQNEITGRDVFLMDQVRATSTTPDFTTRASRYENIPEPSTQFYVFLWSLNGTTAPASTTTWTLGHVSVEQFPNQSVYVQGYRAQGNANALPVKFPAAQSVNATLVAGANLAGDVGLQYRGNATGAGTVVNIASPATPAGISIKSGAGRLLAVNLSNTSTGVRWVKFFNATAVTPGTTAATFERPIAAGGTLELSFDGGLGFSTGMQIMVTAARGLTDNTATGLALGDVSGFTVHA